MGINGRIAGKRTRVALLLLGVGTLAAACLPTAPAYQLPPHPATAGRSSDTPNWAGYAEFNPAGGSWRSIVGQWTVPTVACSPGETSKAYTWVGFDGATDGKVIQAGSTSDCFKGNPVYLPWYSIYDARLGNVITPVTLTRSDNPASAISVLLPGDYVEIIIDHPASGNPNPNSWDFNFVVQRGGISYAWYHVGYWNSAAASAECILEAPGGAANSLANFGRITFQGCEATDASNTIRRLPDHTYFYAQPPTGAIVYAPDTQTTLFNYRIVTNGFARATAGARYGPNQADWFDVVWQHS